MRFRHLRRATIILALIFIAYVAVRDVARRHPENLPWTPLSLLQPVGMFTGAKLSRLAEDTPQCTALLGAAGVGFTALPPLRRDQCGYDNGFTLEPGGSFATQFDPASPGVSCPVAAALVMWERQVVRPAALRHFGAALASIEHFGTYNCRRIAGRSGWSEHATANAIDIAGFIMADGERVRVLAGWTGPPATAAFLREVRDGACEVFATVLSPDYNAAHADHLHLDQARRGGGGGGYCR
jgi:hypothetical protein